jgi:Transposase DDE domain
MLDQSKISDGFECLMVSLRIGERAIPVAWRVFATSGSIGFEDQKPLLDRVKDRMPEGVPILLSADRFYGTSAMVSWCQQAGWQYRIRLKSNLILHHEGGEITTGQAASMNMTQLENATFNNTNVKTHIGILHDVGHPEPWIIAMDCPASKYKVLDYGMRWGIECLFSDFKSRGFSITKTHLAHADRIERLILVLTMALYWAVSTGMQPRRKTKATKKN